MSRHDLVIFGATGFTGTYIVETLIKSGEKVDFAVAGRSETRLKETLEKCSRRIGHELTGIPIIVADSSDEQSLIEMAKRAKIIINAVGPYRLFGEAVVKAAVENGASHVDISGEPAFLEAMQAKFSETARNNGVYVVGACGFDSIPCDLGVNFLKQNFGGQLNHVESFVQINYGPAGYALNGGTYQTLVLGIANMHTDGLGKLRKAIMPNKPPQSQYRAPKRRKIWYNEKLGGWCLPFMGSDKSVVSRSQYFDYTKDNEPPVQLETYLRIKSLLWAFLLFIWLALFAIMAYFEWTRKILQKYPDFCSFNIFKNSGPNEKQISQASFTYWFFGSGWDEKLPPEQQHQTPPSKKVIARCDGPDFGYVATSGAVIASALTILQEADKMPESGGVFTTAAAFKRTSIYDRLKKFGITFNIVENVA